MTGYIYVKINFVPVMNKIITHFINTVNFYISYLVEGLYIFFSMQICWSFSLCMSKNISSFLVWRIYYVPNGIFGLFVFNQPPPVKLPVIPFPNIPTFWQSLINFLSIVTYSEHIT